MNPPNPDLSRVDRPSVGSEVPGNKPEKFRAKLTTLHD
jgi:hypothetical protein